MSNVWDLVYPSHVVTWDLSLRATALQLASSHLLITVHSQVTKHRPDRQISKNSNIE